MASSNVTSMTRCLPDWATIARAGRLPWAPSSRPRLPQAISANRGAIRGKNVRARKTRPDGVSGLDKDPARHGSTITGPIRTRPPRRNPTVSVITAQARRTWARVVESWPIAKRITCDRAPGSGEIASAAVVQRVQEPRMAMHALGSGCGACGGQAKAHETDRPSRNWSEGREVELTSTIGYGQNRLPAGKGRRRCDNRRRLSRMKLPTRCAAKGREPRLRGRSTSARHWMRIGSWLLRPSCVAALASAPTHLEHRIRR
jgi:hypothetical protein